MGEVLGLVVGAAVVFLGWKAWKNRGRTASMVVKNAWAAKSSYGQMTR